eukprot:scaffold21729_cov85-Phaeocystis_antarctica.AAC.7
MRDASANWCCLRDAGESVLIGDLVVRHKVCTAVASPAAALPVPVETGRAQAHCLDLLAGDGVLPGLLLLRLVNCLAYRQACEQASRRRYAFDLLTELVKHLGWGAARLGADEPHDVRWEVAAGFAAAQLSDELLPLRVALVISELDARRLQC